MVIAKLLELPGTHLVRTDMCAHGLSVLNRLTESCRFPAPAMKPTGILTNVTEIADVLDKYRCSGDHEHGHLMGHVARHAQQYTDQFCRAILQGLRR